MMETAPQTTSVEKPEIFPKTTPRLDPTKKMMACEWHGNKDVRAVERAKPLITEPSDVVVRVTTTTVCGSDLHLYHNEFAGMQKGDILGHEGVGIVEEVGEAVKTLKPGDRVAISAVIACGQCEFCKKDMPSLCDVTNPSKEMEQLYGHRTAGLFGYSHLTGGYDGCQAEYVRVPYADNCCLKLPNSVPDEKAISLSDIACTGWHGNELAEVSEGQTVAVWGCGPVGLMTIMWARFRGAAHVYAIDDVPSRLQMAEKLGAIGINFKEKTVVDTLLKAIPGGPDACIDCVGFRYPSSLLHRIERTLKLETDAGDVLREAILCCKKGGKIALIGDYYSYTNQFPIGPMMEKGLTMRGGQVFVQKYWKKLLEFIENGQVDPSLVITHHMSLDDITKAYSMFDQKQENVLKILLHPRSPTM
ncbi:Glutathione-dependent formaldehyde dehydrogenase [Balamuthia mandrillaris]